MKSGSICSVFLIACLAVAGLQGCASRFETGSPPRVERLAQLTPRISTKNDVLLTLGEPRGYGAARLDPTFNPQRIWLYEHTVTEGNDVRLTMLFIFFADDIYDGYMWFADSANLKEYSGGKAK
jgi:hypothetical protein